MNNQGSLHKEGCKGVSLSLKDRLAGFIQEQGEKNALEAR